MVKTILAGIILSVGAILFIAGIIPYSILDVTAIIGIILIYISAYEENKKE